MQGQKLALALLLCLLVSGLHAQTSTPRNRQAGQQRGRQPRNNRSDPSTRPNQQFPGTGYGSSTPKSKRAGDQPGRESRYHTTPKDQRPNQQQPGTGYGSPTPRNRQAGQAPGRPSRYHTTPKDQRPDQQQPGTGFGGSPTPKSKRAGDQPGRKTRYHTTPESQRPDRQFPQNGNNNTSDPKLRPNQQLPRVERSGPAVDKMRSKSHTISRSQKGQTMSRRARRRFMRMQSRIMGPAVEGQVESNAQKRAKAGNAYQPMSVSEIGGATHPAQKSRRQRAQSQLFRSGNGPVQEESGMSKRIRARDQSLRMNRHVEPVIPDYPNQVAIMAAGSADAAEFFPATDEHMFDKMYRAYKKSKQISKARQGWGGVNLAARKAREHQKSLNMANAEMRMTLVRPEQLEMMRDRSKKMATAERGNTMARTDYRAMVKKKSERMAEAERGNTLRREAHIALMRGKSDDIADFDAGYLNTKAERRARRRAFFHPDEFVANTPREQLRKRRETSEDIAAFQGKKRRGKHEVKNAHSSTIAENNKRRIRSYEARESNRKRTAFFLRWNRKGLLPVWMRKKEKKAKYDDVEKGLWYD